MKRKLSEESSEQDTTRCLSSCSGTLSDSSTEKKIDIQVDRIVTDVLKKKRKTTKTTKISDTKWAENYNFCCKLLEMYGNIPVFVISKDGTTKICLRWLSRWLYEQRRNIQKGKLRESRKIIITDMLNKYPALFDLKKIRWDYLKNMTINFFEKFKRFPVKEMKGNEIEMTVFSRNEIVNINLWYTCNLTRYKYNRLSSKKRDKFEKFLMQIERIRYADWNENYAKLLLYIKEHEILPCPITTSLGVWISQIYKRKGNMPPSLEENFDKYEKIKNIAEKYRKHKLKNGIWSFRKEDIQYKKEANS